MGKNKDIRLFFRRAKFHSETMNSMRKKFFLIFAVPGLRQNFGKKDRRTSASMFDALVRRSLGLQFSLCIG